MLLTTYANILNTQCIFESHFILKIKESFSALLIVPGNWEDRVKYL